MNFLEKFGYAIGGFVVGLCCVGCAAFFTAYTKECLIAAASAAVIGVCAQLWSEL